MPPVDVVPSCATGPLATFFGGLTELKNGMRKEHVRVLWLGDSHTNADFLSGTVRSALTAGFGDGGPGFVRGDHDRSIEYAAMTLAASLRLGTSSSGLAERVLGNSCCYRGDVAVAQQWIERMVDDAGSGPPPGDSACGSGNPPGG